MVWSADVGFCWLNVTLGAAQLIPNVSHFLSFFFLLVSRTHRMLLVLSSCFKDDDVDVAGFGDEAAGQSVCRRATD